MNEAARLIRSKIAKVITITALVISTLWCAVPFVLYFTDLKAEHYRYAFLGLFTLLLAFFAFSIYTKKTKLEALLACHALLCVSIILSSAAWDGIPFMDLSYYLSSNIFGAAFFLFVALLFIVVVRNTIVTYSSRRNSTTDKNG